MRSQRVMNSASHRCSGPSRVVDPKESSPLLRQRRFLRLTGNLNGTAVLSLTAAGNVTTGDGRLFQQNWDMLVNILSSCPGDRTEVANGIEAQPRFLDHACSKYTNVFHRA